MFMTIGVKSDPRRSPVNSTAGEGDAIPAFGVCPRGASLAGEEGRLEAITLSHTPPPLAASACGLPGPAGTSVNRPCLLAPSQPPGRTSLACAEPSPWDAGPPRPEGWMLLCSVLVLLLTENLQLLGCSNLATGQRQLRF
jgi:hypothetical protein